MSTALALGTAVATAGSTQAATPPVCVYGDCTPPTPTTSPSASPSSSPSQTPSPSSSPTDLKSSADASLVPAGPTVTANPTSTTSPVSGAATVGGTFTLGNGAALANYPVTITATDAVPADGTAAEDTVVGTATTAADGTWTYTRPPTLPANLQSLADSNGGVLALEATVDGTAPDGTAMTASESVSAGVATDAATTDASAFARSAAATAVPAAMAPDNNTTVAAMPTDTQMAASTASVADANSTPQTIDAPLPAYQSNVGSAAGYNPELLNGVDYGAVTPVPNRSVPCNTVSWTGRTGIYYTNVGEAHAYYDATAAFDYSDALSSTWTIMKSYDGANFKIEGKITRGSTMGVSTGFSGQGPGWARTWMVPIKYAEVISRHQCFGITKSITYRILPLGYQVPGGGVVGGYGANVLYKDGGPNYRAAPLSHRAVIPPKGYFSLNSGTSYGVGWKVTVFGIGVSNDISYNRSHYEKITAGSGNLEHDIWGATDSVWGNPGVIYSF